MLYLRHAHAVDVNIFLRLAIRRPYPDHVTLVGEDVVKLVLAKKTREARITLALFLARLDRHRQVVLVLEPEADHDVGDCFACPIGGDDIGGIELEQVVGAILPARRKIALAPVVEVPHAPDRHQITVHGCVRRNRHFRLPVAIVRRGYAEEQDHQDCEDSERGNGRLPGDGSSAKAKILAVP